MEEVNISLFENEIPGNQTGVELHCSNKFEG